MHFDSRGAGEGGGIAILGGSFNPLHIGHMRLAIEVREALPGLVSQVDFIPCANPPHKPAGSLLPFAMRAALVREAIAPYPWMRCNEVEAQRSLPSYTWDTLGIYREEAPGRELFFILGSPDYDLLPSWHNGLFLPKRCTLVVVPRGHFSSVDFCDATRRLWRDAVEVEEAPESTRCMAVPGMGRVLFLPVPWLEISASLVRERWMQGRCVDFLVPRGVAHILATERDAILPHWK